MSQLPNKGHWPLGPPLLPERPISSIRNGCGKFCSMSQGFCQFLSLSVFNCTKSSSQRFFSHKWWRKWKSRLCFEIWKHYQDFFPLLSIIRKWGHKSLFYYFNVKNPGWRRRKNPSQRRKSRLKPARNSLWENLFFSKCSLSTWFLMKYDWLHSGT